MAQHRQKYWGPDPTYGWPDPDFIFTGGQGCAPRGKTNPPGQRCPGQTDTEYVTECSLWAIAGGQIVLATDPRYTNPNPSPNRAGDRSPAYARDTSAHERDDDDD